MANNCSLFDLSLVSLSAIPNVLADELDTRNPTLESLNNSDADRSDVQVHLNKDNLLSEIFVNKFTKADETASNQNSKLWWSDILNSKKLKEYKTQWKRLAFDGMAREQEVNSIQCLYKQTAYFKTHVTNNKNNYDALMGTVIQVPGEFSFWMPGVALVASYLAEKNNIDGLYVCKTLEAFVSRLKEISLSDSDQRCAFVIGLFMSGGKKQGVFGHDPNYPQHKATVCVEKKQGSLTIALLDAQPLAEVNKDINPDHLTDRLWSGYDQYNKFNDQELAFRAILKACSDVKGDIRFLHSQVERQIGYGCVAFALHDAICYLRDPDFFKKILCAKEVVELKNGRQIEIITQLPPEFMIGTQSSQLLEQYIREVPQKILDQPIRGKKKPKTLQNCLDDNQVTVLVQGNPKIQNHFITKKTFKHFHFVTESLNILSLSKIQEIVDKTLLTKDESKDE